MTRSHTSSEPSLEDVMYALSIEQPMPDAKLLDDFIRRYPQYSEELTDFAVALVLDALDDTSTAPEKFSEEVAATAGSPTVSRSVSRFHSKLHAVRTASKSSDDAGVSPERTNAPNPFAALSPEDFESVAARLDVTKMFMSRLRDRIIEFSTIPEQFIAEVAETLKVPIGTVSAHLASPSGSALSNAEFYKADNQPEIIQQQTFEQAVDSSGLSGKQKKRLLSY